MQCVHLFFNVPSVVYVLICVHLSVCVLPSRATVGCVHLVGGGEIEPW